LTHITAEGVTVTAATYAHEKSRNLGIVRSDSIRDVAVANAGKTGDAFIIVYVYCFIITMLVLTLFIFFI
jgi:hypothetical protein